MIIRLQGRQLFFGAGVCLAVFGLTYSASAAGIAFKPSAVDIGPGRAQMAALTVIPGPNERFNAFDISVPVPGGITVERVMPVDSPTLVWVRTPRFDKAKGSVTLTGGFTKPVASPVTLARVIFAPAADAPAGTVTVMPQGTVLAADGKGTELTVTNAALTLNILASTAPTASAPSAAETPRAPVLTSPSHPDEWRWSQNTTWQVTWDAAANTTYSYTLTRSGESTPVKTGTTTSGSVSFPNLADGIYTLSVQAQNPNGAAGQAVGRMALIDTRPPQPFGVRVSRNSPLFDGKTFLTFHTYDILSGVARYQVRAGSQGTFKPAQSPYVINDPSLKTATVRAIDNAGNARDVTVALRPANALYRALEIVAVLFVALGLAWWLKRRR